MNYLFSVNRSASWKNQYISALNEIYQEGQFWGCKVYKPNFPSIDKTPNKADIFKQGELERLFKRSNFSHDFFFLFFLCTLSGGLRLGETRALRAKQIVFERKAIIIDGFLKKKRRANGLQQMRLTRTPQTAGCPLPVSYPGTSAGAHFKEWHRA